MDTDAPDGTAGPLLEVDDVRTYLETPRGVVRAVDGVSLALPEGRALGIVGESGSGKSMLLRSIINIVPRTARLPTGRVLFEGRDLRTMTTRDLRRVWGPGIGIVFQDPNTSLNPVLTVERQITEGPRLHHLVDRAGGRDLAIALLRQVGIPEPERHLRSFPHRLSGGMRQRVAIAVALACDPKLLLADEITSALDVTVQAQTMDLLAREQRNRGMAMIFVTHNVALVADRTDTIAVMYGGRIVEYAPTLQLFRRPRHPYTLALMECAPAIDAPSRTRVAPIPGHPPDLVAPRIGCSFAPRCRSAQERCMVEDPALTSDAHGAVACWYPIDTPEGLSAVETNQSRGRTAAGLALASPAGMA